MKLFDRVDPTTVERREFQLAIFSLLVLIVLAAGLAVVMYPTVTRNPVYFSALTAKILYFGFCGLCLLLFMYLIDRQVVVRRLRREVTQAQARYSELHGQAGKDVLDTLPATNRFQDQLMMEYKRAVNCGDALSIVVVRVKPAATLKEAMDIAAALGDAARTISRRLRKEDSLYNFSGGAFGMLLPATNLQDARLVAARISDGLCDAAGAINRFSSDIKIFNYPQNAGTAHELEAAVLALLPTDSNAEVDAANAVGAGEQRRK